jgi:small-conductance mechanosensitive channel
MILGLSMTHISLIIGGLGFSIGFGLQSIIKEIIYGLFIVVKKSVRVGDFVEIREAHVSNISTTGEIIKISMLHTHILDENLMVIAVPNSYVLENALINYSASAFMNKCYINCVLNNEENLESIHEQIWSILKNEPRIVQKGHYQPIIKTFSTNNHDNTNSVLLNINFYIPNLSEKLMVVSHIKNEIINQLKLEIKKT